ncbi:MAG: hypothetical protein KC553_01395 [Nitrospina sp.]|nr:hypothetical protein [Nitrospina sp.]
MQEPNWEEAFHRVAEGAKVLKKEALNRHDREFDPWYRQARSLLLRYCPVKIPAFDEIRFASDFFLGKSGEAQLDINDRIALVCDLDLALEIFEHAGEIVADELRRKKSRDRIGGGASMQPPVPPQPAAAESFGAQDTPESAPATNADPLLEQLEAMDLSRREKEEAREEIERVIALLKTPDPDWDRVRRTLKFLLDFDKTLALNAVPELLQRYKHHTRR